MQIQSTRRDLKLPRPWEPGLLLGIPHPPPPLAEKGRELLELPLRPDRMLLAIPASSVSDTDLEKAIRKTGEKVAKLVSKKLAKASNVPAIEYGVDAFWIGVGVWKLYRQWSDPGANTAALMVRSAGSALDLLQLGLEVGGVDTPLLTDANLQEKISLTLSGASALAEGDGDLSMAVLNQRFRGTRLGQSLDLVSPLVNLALSSDPATEGIQLKPLPTFSLPQPPGPPFSGAADKRG